VGRVLDRVGEGHLDVSDVSDVGLSPKLRGISSAAQRRHTVERAAELMYEQGVAGTSLNTPWLAREGVSDLS
jgi:hypothetical protein